MLCARSTTLSKPGVIEGPCFVDVCERCDTACDRRVFDVRTGKVRWTITCVCGGRLIRKPLHEWLNGEPTDGK